MLRAQADKHSLLFTPQKWAGLARLSIGTGREPFQGGVDKGRDPLFLLTTAPTDRLSPSEHGPATGYKGFRGWDSLSVTPAVALRRSHSVQLRTQILVKGFPANVEVAGNPCFFLPRCQHACEVLQPALG